MHMPPDDSGVLPNGATGDSPGQAKRRRERGHLARPVVRRQKVAVWGDGT